MLSFDGGGAAVGINGELAVVGIGSVARIIDISNPDSPLFLSDLVLPAALSGVAFVGSHAVLTDQSRNLHIVDLEDPRDPIEVASIEGHPWVREVSIAGDRLYVRSDDLLRLYQVSHTGALDDIGRIPRDTSRARVLRCPERSGVCRRRRIRCSCLWSVPVDRYPLIGRSHPTLTLGG